MSIVYVTQATPHDLAAATQFGWLKILLKQAKDQTFAPQPVFRFLKNELKDFSDNDYLVLVGDPVAMALAVNAAGQANNGRVRLLKWSQKHARYCPIEIDLHDRSTTQNYGETND
jgi:hypothetical protein